MVDLPKLPPMKRPRIKSNVHPVSAALKKAKAALRDNPSLKPADSNWGAQAPGRWYAVDRSVNPRDAVAGVCEACGEPTRALDLKPRRQLDGTDAWICKECKDADVPKGEAVPKIKRKPVELVQVATGGMSVMRAMLNELTAVGIRRMRWHPPMGLHSFAEPEEIKAAFVTAGHIANAILREGAK